MEFQLKEHGNILVICLSGKMDATAIPGFEDDFNQLINQGWLNFVLNLENLSYMSSAGIRLLLLLNHKLIELEGKLLLCCVPDSVSGIMKLSGVDQVLPFYESERDCFARF
ncbi:STAS domain-containing protein [Chlamydiifrater phoenicopteri]|uniref:STAS domain-containing protein n=1 Tax=Chlamydiifrater phoenicopteri TaxID=2681469 RepID=UPI001BCEEA82|nr:STAS domain-containing protein [Chlamydiifrater phoenicopteri]